MLGSTRGSCNILWEEPSAHAAQGCRWHGQSVVKKPRGKRTPASAVVQTWLMLLPWHLLKVSSLTLLCQQPGTWVIYVACCLSRFECWIQEDIPLKKGTFTWGGKKLVFKKLWYLKQGSGNYTAVSWGGFLSRVAMGGWNQNIPFLFITLWKEKS